jgi:nucleoid DNA-binding protein
MKPKLQDSIRLSEIIDNLPYTKTKAEKSIIKRVVKLYFKYVKQAVLEGHLIEIPYLGGIWIKKFPQYGKRNVYSWTEKKMIPSPLFIPHRIGFSYKICMLGYTVGQREHGMWFMANEKFRIAMHNILRNTYKEYRTDTYQLSEPTDINNDIE